MVEPWQPNILLSLIKTRITRDGHRPKLISTLAINIYSYPSRLWYDSLTRRDQPEMFIIVKNIQLNWRWAWHLSVNNRRYLFTALLSPFSYSFVSQLSKCSRPWREGRTIQYLINTFMRMILEKKLQNYRKTIVFVQVVYPTVKRVACI